MDIRRAWRLLFLHSRAKYDPSKHPKWPKGTEGGKGGKWKPKGMSGWSAQIVDWLRANGGFSVHPDTGAEPTTGYMVAIADHSGISPAERFYSDAEYRDSQIYDWLKKESAQFDLDPTNMYIGGWLDATAGVVVLDPSENVFGDMQHAIDLGVQRNQVTIYDVVNHEIIDTGGTGGYRAVGGSNGEV